MKNDLSIFRYSTILILTRAGMTTFKELEQMTDSQIRKIRGMGWRSYKEIIEKLGRSNETIGT